MSITSVIYLIQRWRFSMKRVFAAAAFLVLSAMCSVQAEDDLEAYPPAEKGMIRHVVRLPKQDDEFAFQIELIAGKTIKVDPVNHHYFNAKFKEEVIAGWEVSRYNIGDLGGVCGTLLYAGPNKVERFVTLGGEPFLIRYNSRRPVVVYAPAGVEIRYRVWKAEPKAVVIEKG
jgi:ecotin